MAIDTLAEHTRLGSAFIANIGYQIRAPLNVVLGLNRSIAEHLAEMGDHSQDRFFAGINRAGDTLLTTIQEVLDYLRIQAGAFEINPVTLDIATIIEKQVRHFEPVAKAKGVTLVQQTDVDDATVLFDKYCLRQTVTNLISNAVRLTDHGEIKVSLSKDESRALCIDVTDTGIGMDAAQLSRLFTTSLPEKDDYARAFAGAGLGLILAKSYLELNGATIEIQSRQGKGTLARIRIPSERTKQSEARAREPGLASAGRSPAENRPTPVEGKARKRTTENSAALLVEDEPLTQVFMGEMLGKYFEVLPAASGAEARQQLAAHGDRISLVLMDLSLKGDEDGLMLTRSLRADKRWRSIPIIATTAHASAEDEEKALEAGCNAFLTKPISRDTLVETIQFFVPEVPGATSQPTPWMRSGD